MYIIRPFTPADLPLMEEFLYQAIFQRPGTPVIPRSELEKPSIRVYIDRFGEYPDDHCLCAELDGAVVGMVWVRNIKGFGSIDETTPEFAISLLPDARGKGIGTALMRAMLKGEFVPYLLIGFVISCFLDFSNLLPVAIIGASLALIAYNTECKISGKTVAVEQTDNRTGRIVEKKDITRLGLASMFLQASFNYERMQAGGFLCAQLPLLKKIYKDDKEGLSAAMQDNLEFITTHPNMAGFLMGLLISMEEAKADRSTIKGLKLALFAPLAGVGDAIFWFTLLPIVGGIAASMAMDGSIAGPVIFFLTYLAVFIFRIVLTHLGYNLGTKAIGFITEGAEKIGRAATILGCTVIGALIASYVKLSVNLEIPVNEVKTVHIQTDFFDKIFPNILSIGYVFLMYYLLKKKKFKPITLIIGTFLLAIVCSFFGIL